MKLIPERVMLIPEDAKHIGIMVSGGMDSAVLLCMLVSESQANDIEITAFTVNKNSSQRFSKRIVKAVERKFGKAINIEDGCENPNPKAFEIKPAILKIAERDDIDFVYTGVTMNPPEELVKLGGTYPDRPHGKNNPYPKILMPFEHMMKNEVVEIAHNRGLMDIVALSHTCTEIAHSRCGQCFACHERNWAFDYAGIPQPAETPLTLEQYYQ